MEKLKCYKCGQTVYKQEIFKYYDGTTEEPIDVCNDCMNQKMIEILNIQYNGSDLLKKEVYFKDYDGNKRGFEVINHLIAKDIFFLKAYEVNTRNDGYEFTVKGEFDINNTKQMEQLYQKLCNKIQKGISKKYICTDEISMELGNAIIDNSIVGRFASNEENQELPYVVIDGIKYSWTEFGRILSGQEDAVFKMKIYNPDEDYLEQ